MQVVLAVAAGGALGAISRYALASGVANLLDLQGGGTVVANLLGAFLLGLIVGLSEERCELSEPVRVGVTVGLLGGFTTFSTYMYDVGSHAEDDRWITSVGMLVLTVAVGLLAMVAGLAAGRSA